MAAASAVCEAPPTRVTFQLSLSVGFSALSFSSS